MNIREIAAAANVSVSTVSKIINHKDQDISDSTRQKVLKIVKEYQYTPYSNLKDLTTQTKTWTIALFVQPSLFDSQFLYTVEQAASSYGYSLLICNITEPLPDSVRKYLKIMENRKTDGILLALSSRQLIDQAVNANTTHIPIVSVSLEQTSSCSVFHYDYQTITRMAVEYLIELGHEKIGCILDSTDTSCLKRCINVYEETMKGLTAQQWQPYVLTTQNSYEQLHQGVSEMLKANVTAFYCQTFPLANMVYEISKEGKYYIPNSISVICGESSPHTKYFIPSLTSYSIPVSEIASKSVEYLIQCIESRNARTPKLFSFPPIFCEGGSTAPPPSVGKQILVIGNCSIDTIIHTPKIPENGDLLFANNVTVVAGGKGVDQAVGAGKLGGSVYALGCVGNDADGNTIYDSLKRVSVHVEGITTTAAVSTGKAYITVPAYGNSTVVSYPGANYQFQVQHVKAFRYLFSTASYCLLSTELNWEVITYVLKKCVQNNVQVFLKPSVGQEFPKELLNQTAFFVPNQNELEYLLPGDESIPQKADILYSSGCQNVIVTLGHRGCYLKNKDYAMYIPAAPFRAVDTTGAANCFIAAMAVSLSRGESLLYSICYATYAAGISVTQPGIQTSFPDKNQLDIYLDEIQEMYLSLCSSQKK